MATRRSAIRTALTVALTLGVAGAAQAQEFPIKGRPIVTIVPSTAGGGTDVAARLAAPLLAKELGVPVEVVNRPGASMQIGLTEAANAKPDGHTLVWSVLPTAASIYLDSERGSPFRREALAPIAMYYGAPFGVVVRADSPHKTVKDVVEAAKANPGKVRGGTTGFMSTGHFASIAFQNGTGTRLATVNFQGGGPQLQALLGGHIDVGFNSIGELLVQHKAGAVRVIAVMDKSRSELLPDVPATAETGYAIEPIGSDIGLSAPAQTPKPILDRLGQAMRTIMQDPALKARMLELGNTLTPGDAREYAKFWDAVDARFKPLIETAKQQAK